MGEGQETANLTLLVDGEEQKGEEVTKEESGNGIVLTLDWRARNLTVGQSVVVSCTGQAGSVLISQSQLHDQLVAETWDGPLCPL